MEEERESACCCGRRSSFPGRERPVRLKLFAMRRVTLFVNGTCTNGKVSYNREAGVCVLAGTKMACPAPARPRISRRAEAVTVRFVRERAGGGRVRIAGGPAVCGRLQAGHSSLQCVQRERRSHRRHRADQVRGLCRCNSESTELQRRSRCFHL